MPLWTPGAGAGTIRGLRKATRTCEPSPFLARRAAPNLVAAAFGAFVALHLLAALVRVYRHVLFWWGDAPSVFVVLSWTWVLAQAAAGGLAAAWLAGRIEPLLPEKNGSERAGLAFAGVTLVTAIGVALRFVAPVSVPPGVWLDVFLEAERLLRSPQDVPWLGGTPLSIPGAHEIVSHLLLRLYEGLLLLFGRGDVGILSLSALPAALTVPAAGWLAYEAFGRRASVLAAAFVAFSSRSLALSRWGYTPATLVPLALATVAAALAARRRGSLSLAALSGVFAGLAMHTHSSALVVPVALAAWSVGTWKEPGARGRAAAAAGAALLAAGPWLIGFVQHPGYFGGRLRDVNLGNPVRDVDTRHAGPATRLVLNAIDYTGLFVFTKDPNGRHGFPERAAAPVAVGLAAMVGFAVLLRRSVKDPGAPRALLWLAAGSLAAGVLSDPGGAPNTVRACILVATGFVVAAWVVDGVASWLASRVGARPGVLLLLVGAGFFVRETVPFLADWPGHPMVISAFCPEESDAGRLARRLGPAPLFLERDSVPFPLVLETLAASPDARVAVPPIPTTTPGRLLASPPPVGSFWLVATRRFPEPLAAAGWTVSRPVQAGTGRALHVFRIRPPAPPR